MRIISCVLVGRCVRKVCFLVDCGKISFLVFNGGKAVTLKRENEDEKKGEIFRICVY